MPHFDEEGKKKTITFPFHWQGVLKYVKNERREKILRRREKIIVVLPHPRNRSIVTHTNIRKFVPFLNQYSESSQRKKKSDVLWKFRYHNCVMKSLWEVTQTHASVIRHINMPLQLHFKFKKLKRRVAEVVW